jgi:LemA protein
MRSLSETEAEIQGSRRIYNSNVQPYNTKIQAFPGSVIAGAGAFSPREFFAISERSEREPVKISF